MKKVLLLFIMVTSYSIGAQTPIQNFTLTNVVDGSMQTLENYANTVGVAVLFTSNDCPSDDVEIFRSCSHSISSVGRDVLRHHGCSKICFQF